MTAYDFSFVKNTSITFDPTADSINMGAIDASSMNVGSDASGNLVLTVNNESVTLQGANAAQVTTTNVTFGAASSRSAWIVGDNDTASTIDAIGNTLNEPAFATNENNLFYGLGGADTIDAGNGNNLIFGGAGMVDADDDGDTISIGGGANTIYSNAGNDSIVDDTTTTATGTLNTIYLGLGNDTLDLDIANAGNYLAYGNTGTDNIEIQSTGSVTLYGGNGVVDSTDGNDTLNASGAGSALIYGNAGDDDIDVGATAANNTASVFGGLGGDTIDAGGVANSSSLLYGNTGADSVTSTSAGSVTIFGGNGIVDSTDGNDTLTGGTGNNTIYGNAGDDVIVVAGGGANTASTIFTGLGDDTVNVGVNANGTTANNNNADTTTTVTLAAGSERVNFDAAASELLTINGFDGANDVVAFDLSGGNAADLSLSTSGFLYYDAGANGSYDSGADDAINFSGLSSDFTSSNLLITTGGIGGASAGLVVTNLFGSSAATLTGGANQDLLQSGDQGDTLVSNNTATGAGTGDKMIGAAGDDTFQVDDVAATAFNANQYTISGGNGADTLEITGDGAVTLQDADFPNTITSVETIVLSNNSGHSVTLGTSAATAGVRTVNASAVASGTTTIDVSALGEGATVTAGAATDTITMSAAAGDNDSISAGSGNDVIDVATLGLESTDTINGGDGSSDDLRLTDAATVVDADFTNVTNVEELHFRFDGATAQSATLGTLAQAAGIRTFDASNQDGTSVITVDASAYTESIVITGGDGADVITGGAGADTITTDEGDDVVTGGGGADVIILENTDEEHINIDATGDFGDIVRNFETGAGNDVMDLNVTVAGNQFQLVAAGALNFGTHGVNVIDADVATASANMTAAQVEAAAITGFGNIDANESAYIAVSSNHDGTADTFIYYVTANAAGDDIASATHVATLEAIQADALHADNFADFT